jgi:hypothetical protein
VVPDPLATAQDTLRSPITAGGYAGSPMGKSIYASGSDDEPGAQFLNGLPPPAAGGADAALPPAEPCGSSPFALLRCGPGQ